PCRPPVPEGTIYHALGISQQLPIPHQPPPGPEPVLSNASDSFQRVARAVESWCAQACGQPVQTRRGRCAQPGDTVVEIAADCRELRPRPARTFCPGCAYKIF